MVKHVKCIGIFPEFKRTVLEVGKVYPLNLMYEGISKTMGINHIYSVNLPNGLIGQYPKGMFEEVIE